MTKTFLHGCRTFLLITCLYTTGYTQSYHQTGGISYPFRAAPAIAQAGFGFHILYSNRLAQTVDSVLLKGKRTADNCPESRPLKDLHFIF